MKKNQWKEKVLKRIFGHTGKLKNKYIYVLILLFFTGIGLLINHYRIIWKSQATQVPQQVTILKSGYQIGVVSLNLDKDVDMNGRGDVSGAKPLKDMISESLAEGKTWDIVGLQEMKESRPEKPRNEKDFDDFIRIMAELDQGNYSCVKQQEFSNDFFSGICTKYPIIENSYREKVIWRSSTTDQARVFLCIQVQSPAGILPVCTTHPRAGSNPPAQFKDAENWLFSTVLDSYVPNDISVESRQTYINSLRARLIVTGDMNTGVNTIQGRLMTACGGIAPPNTSCDIDQVMYANMTYPEFQHQAPFNQQYLISEGGYRDTTRPWPTDHGGPSIVSFTTKELTVQIAGEVPATPTSTVIPPTAIPTQSISVHNPNVLNGKPVIRMINFNPGGGSANDDITDQRTAAWTEFAQYVKDQNVEILMLQEPGNREIGHIRNVLSSAFPYYTWIQYPGRGGETNPIFSRYPFVEGSQQEWLISQTHNGDNKQRVVLSINVKTPYGIIRVVNLHTHGDYQCEDAYHALKPIISASSPYYNPPTQNFIIAGDFNIKLEEVTPYNSNDKNSGAILYRVVCEGKGDQYIDMDEFAEMIRINYKANCIEPAVCQNKTGRGQENIEMVWSLNGNPIEIYRMWDGDSYFQDAFRDRNRHPVVFAEIGDLNWDLPPTPTEQPPRATPTGTTTPNTTPTVSVTPSTTVTQPTNITPTPKPADVTMNISFRLQGLSNRPKTSQALKAKIFIESADKSFKKEQQSDFTSDQNGIWKGQVTFSQVPIEKKYSVSVKPQKHLKMKYCESHPAAAGTDSCTVPTIQLTSNTVLEFENTLIFAGDIDSQNGIIDSYDLSYLRNNLGKKEQVVLAIGDLNLDGILDTQDYVLAISALKQRTDQN